MSKQVMFYGNIQKAQTVLACVQASIETVAKDISKGGAGSRAILTRYLAELEEIETDLVALLNSVRTQENYGDPRDGSWAPDASDRDVL